MKEKIKRKNYIYINLSNYYHWSGYVTYGVYFGVLTNVLINAFWNSKLFPEKTNLDSNKHRVLNETVKRPVVD
jgi:hypothetical protein